MITLALALRSWFIYLFIQKVLNPCANFVFWSNGRRWMLLVWLLPEKKHSNQRKYCGFCSNRTLPYFPRSVFVLVYRRDISTFLNHLMIKSMQTLYFLKEYTLTPPLHTCCSLSHPVITCYTSLDPDKPPWDLLHPIITPHYTPVTPYYNPLHLSQPWYNQSQLVVVRAAEEIDMWVWAPQCWVGSRYWLHS